MITNPVEMVREKGGGEGGGIGEHMQLGDNRGAHPFPHCPPGATVGFGDSSLTAMRNLGVAVFTIIRTGSAQALSQPTVVYFNISSNGSAVEGVDFILLQRAVTFGPNSTSVEGVVVILEHSGVDLQQRSFQISLTAVENGSLGTDGRLLTVVIISSQSKLSVVHVRTCACEGVASTSCWTGEMLPVSSLPPLLTRVHPRLTPTPCPSSHSFHCTVQVL